jgi:hypothetical protein
MPNIDARGCPILDQWHTWLGENGALLKLTLVTCFRVKTSSSVASKVLFAASGPSLHTWPSKRGDGRAVADDAQLRSGGSGSTFVSAQISRNERRTCLDASAVASNMTSEPHESVCARSMREALSHAMELLARVESSPNLTHSEAYSQLAKTQHEEVDRAGDVACAPPPIRHDELLLRSCAIVEQRPMHVVQQARLCGGLPFSAAVASQFQHGGQVQPASEPFGGTEVTHPPDSTEQSAVTMDRDELPLASCAPPASCFLQAHRPLLLLLLASPAVLCCVSATHSFHMHVTASPS